jgi:hypothetical protein
MKKYLLPLALLSTSCGSALACKTEVIPRRDQGPAPCTVDNMVYMFNEKLRPQIESFSADALKRGVPCLKTRKAIMEDKFPEGVGANVIGYCQAPWTISFLKSYWDKASAADRMTLVYHELGHCALNLDHYDEGQDIMNTYLLPGDIAEEKWDKLVNNMFGRVNQ